MNKLFSEYFSIIAYVFLGIVFGFTFFLLFSQVYHFSVVNHKYDIKTSGLDNISNKKMAIKKNLNNNSNSSFVSKKLNYCYNSLTDKNINKYLEKNKLSNIDIYNFLEIYDKKINSDCFDEKFMYIINKSDKVFKSNYLLLINQNKNNVSSLRKTLSYINDYVYDFNYEKCNTLNNYNDLIDLYNFSLDIVNNMLKEEW